MTTPLLQTRPAANKRRWSRKQWLEAQKRLSDLSLIVLASVTGVLMVFYNPSGLSLTHLIVGLESTPARLAGVATLGLLAVGAARWLRHSVLHLKGWPFLLLLAAYGLFVWWGISSGWMSATGAFIQWVSLFIGGALFTGATLIGICDATR